MPRGDGTGPNSMGAMTGRAAGYCAGYNVPGFANAPGGRGMGRGGGSGMGRRRGWGGGGQAAGQFGWAPPQAAAQMQQPAPAEYPVAGDPRAALEQQVASLQAQLTYVQERLQAMDVETPAEEE
jgi:hypothetical protein